MSVLFSMLSSTQLVVAAMSAHRIKRFDHVYIFMATIFTVKQTSYCTRLESGGGGIHVVVMEALNRMHAHSHYLVEPSPVI